MNYCNHLLRIRIENFANNSLRSAVFLLAIVFLTIACSENAPVIPPLGPQELVERNVIIEEFTGVRCPNCPDGAAEIENLKARFGDNLIPVSIHSSGSFAFPLPESKYDFRTDAGDQLLEFLGQPLGYPSAVVNRIAPSNAGRLQQGQAIWAGLIEEILKEPPSLAINLIQTYDSTSRNLMLDVSMLLNKAINESLFLSVMLLENGVVDAQLDFDGLVEDYEHNHILRFMLTPFDGKLLGERFAIGTFIEQSFSFRVPEEWIAINCELVAFVHYNLDATKAVLQAERVKLEVK